MTASPKDRLLTHLTRYGHVFLGWQPQPDGTQTRTYRLRHGPTAEWHHTHWRVDDAMYPPGSEFQVALRLATQSWPTTRGR